MKSIKINFRRLLFSSVNKPLLLLMGFLLFNLFHNGDLKGQSHANQPAEGQMLVGLATVDITPDEPIRLAGYGSRDSESEGVLQPLFAKAMAFGSDRNGPSILITLDLIGIPGHITDKLKKSLSEKVGLNPSQLAICASHTHTGPEVGNLLNHFGGPLPPGELAPIAKYVKILTPTLEQLALEALDNRSPANVAWGQGKVDFAVNRRVIENGEWTGFGVVPEGPVDHDMPMLRVNDPEGNLRAILVNYACHGTTLGGSTNQIHGDWMGEAQRIMEENHPGATAMVAIGCAGDANPEPREKLAHTTQHGQAIADEVDRLLKSQLNPLTTPPSGSNQEIALPYHHVPDIRELKEETKLDGAEGYYARVALERMARGKTIPEALNYPIQTWTFGNELAMVFLAGEVVADYSLRLKDELDAGRLWINAYANEVPCYIASERVIKEGGYEVDRSMYSYDKPARFKVTIEDMIIEAVHGLVPNAFNTQAQKR